VGVVKNDDVELHCVWLEGNSDLEPPFPAICVPEVRFFFFFISFRFVLFSQHSAFNFHVNAFHTTVACDMQPGEEFHPVRIAGAEKHGS
jgi:hypothetical protein